MAEIKPCPFCGGEAQYNNHVGNNDDYYVEFIECIKCGCSTAYKRWEQDELIRTWNRRSNDGERKE